MHAITHHVPNVNHLSYGAEPRFPNASQAKAGGMKHGSHGKFIFAADSDAERTRWLDAIQANSKASEYQSRIAAIARRAPVSSPAKKNTATKPPLVTCPPSREQVDARGLDID